MWRLVFVACAVVTVSADLVSVDRIGAVSNEEKTSPFWLRDGQRRLRESLRMRHNGNRARNVIMFLGDGMGVTSVTAIRILKGQKKGRSGEEERLVFDDFPHVSLSKTYGVDRQTSDSANTATAYLCGVKGNYGTLGVDGRVVFENCESSVNASTHVDSILRWAQEQGKWTGFVTSTRVTHATPAGLYAHTASRNWESTTPDTARCKDIASQLVQDSPGKDIRVIMGGGRRHFIPGTTMDADGSPGSRLDGRNLFEEYIKDKNQKKASHRVIFGVNELRNVNPVETDYLLGLFHSNHMPYVLDRQNQTKEYPTLPEMTEKAIQILNRGPHGFFLLVEGGKIDMAHHDNQAYKALEEGVEFDEAIATALRMIDLDETLVVVTADHSHAFTIGGDYPLRGTPIVGLGGISNVDNLTFTTLGYNNGPGYKKESRERNLTQEEAVGEQFMQDVLFPMKWATHGAEDVSVYAIGPHAHLFHGVHEQSYIPYAMGYASCLGPNTDLCSGATLVRSWMGMSLSFVAFTFNLFVSRVLL